MTSTLPHAQPIVFDFSDILQPEPFEANVDLGGDNADPDADADGEMIDEDNDADAEGEAEHETEATMQYPPVVEEEEKNSPDINEDDDDLLEGLNTEELETLRGEFSNWESLTRSTNFEEIA